MPTQPFRWRHQYEPDTDEAIGESVAIEFKDPSLTQQQYKDEVDLNVMVARMGLHDGSIPPGSMDPRLFGDFTDAVDLRDVFDRARAATEHFGELPADIRRRFRDNPAELLDWVNDPANVQEAVTLGFLDKSALEAFPAASPPAAETKP